MDEEDKKLLKEELEVNKENNKLLNEIISYQRWSRWLNIIKWVIVVGTTLGALYFVQPMLDGALNYYKTILDTVSSTSVNALPGQ